MEKLTLLEETLGIKQPAGIKGYIKFEQQFATVGLITSFKKKVVTRGGNEEESIRLKHNNCAGEMLLVEIQNKPYELEVYKCNKCDWEYRTSKIHK